MEDEKVATQQNYARADIGAQNPIFSAIRTTIETAYMRNNVVKIENLQQAYELAYQSPGTIVTDMPVFEPKKIGLEEGAKVLLFNDGETTGRFAAARRILGEANVNEKEYAGKLREAVYHSRFRKMYHAEVFIGLDGDFMVKAHLLISEGHENILYNWMLNFQYNNDEYKEMYKASKKINGEGDIYIFSDPEWDHEEHKDGLSLFDPEHNCAAILGMRYFGEHKKGTLTLAWGIANRNDYVSCHGGLKRFTKNDEKYVMGVFGLSGSGKSTITHDKHNNKYDDITVVHDDAYIISVENGSTVALEPSYFDKTQDYPLSEPANKFLITAQNCGACRDEDGKIVLVTEDIRNGNGRAIKSKLWAANRLDKLEEPINSIVWLMKDPLLPPVLKITNPELAAVMGATLATKRTTAEKLAKNIDQDALVIEPYANPFRTYPLKDEYNKFKELFEGDVDCYVVNTGSFLDKKVSKETTLEIVEQIADGTASFEKWAGFENLEILPIEGFEPDMNDGDYLERLEKSFRTRIDFIENKAKENNGRDTLDQEAVDILKVMINNINHIQKIKIA